MMNALLNTTAIETADCEVIKLDFTTAREPKSDAAKAIAAAAQALADAPKKQGGIKDMMEGRSDIFRINPYLLNVKDGWNVREMDDPENAQHITELARSIAEVGVRNPLTVYFENGKLYLSDGHCRLMATFMAIEVFGAEVRTVPVKTEDRYSTEADRVFSQIVLNSGKPLTPFERSTNFHRLLGLGWTEDMIAAKSGIGKSRVIQILELKLLPDAVKTLVRQGKIAPTLAAQVWKENGEDADATVSAISEGFAAATSEGRDKVTRRFVKGGKTNKLEEMKAIFEAADIDNSDADKTTVTFTAEQFDKVRALLGL